MFLELILNLLCEAISNGFLVKVWVWILCSGSLKIFYLWKQFHTFWQKEKKICAWTALSFCTYFSLLNSNEMILLISKMCPHLSLNYNYILSCTFNLDAQFKLKLFKRSVLVYLTFIFLFQLRHESGASISRSTWQYFSICMRT